MILLDTHVILWLRLGLHLGQHARTAIDQAWEAGEIAVSAISFWEIALLKSRAGSTSPMMSDYGGESSWRKES